MADWATISSLALGLRNGGSGLAVLHGWRAVGGREPDAAPDAESFRLQQLDLYVPAGDAGVWLGALRDPSDPSFRSVRHAFQSQEIVQVDLLYGDHEGGQRTVARFLMRPWPDREGLRSMAVRYWNLDRDDPRRRPEG